MMTEQQQLLSKAKESLQAAQILESNGLSRYAKEKLTLIIQKLVKP